MPFDEQREPRRWGGLSDDPEKAARQLAGLARTNRALAARLAAALPGDPGNTPGTPGDLRGSPGNPGKTPAVPRIVRGSPQQPGKMPARPGRPPGEASVDGADGRASGARRARSSKVVQGAYWPDLDPVDPQAKASARENVPPLTTFERFYARLLGYPVERTRPDGTDAEAPRLSALERLYGRILGYDV